MPELTNPITGGRITVSDDLAADFLGRGFVEALGAPAEKPEPDADKPAPKRGRPRKDGGD